MKLQRVLFLCLVAAVVVQLSHLYPLLPERVASHFDAAGRANGWTTKSGFIRVYILLLVAMSSMFFLLPKLILKLPDSLINLPDKAYWLAPERRAETAAKIESYLNAAGNATIAFLMFVLQLTFVANLTPGGELGPGIWIALIVLGSFMAGWSVAFRRAFRR